MRSLALRCASFPRSSESERVLGPDHPDTLMFRRNLDLAQNEHHQ